MKNKGQIATSSLASAVVIGVAVAAAGVASAEDRPGHGFVSDPWCVAIMANGFDPTEFMNGAHRGWISIGTPTHGFRYDAPRLLFDTFVECGIDTAAMIQAASGSYFCSEHAWVGTGMAEFAAGKKPVTTPPIPWWDEMDVGVQLGPWWSDAYADAGYACGIDTAAMIQAASGSYFCSEHAWVGIGMAEFAAGKKPVTTPPIPWPF